MTLLKCIFLIHIFVSVVFSKLFPIEGGGAAETPPDSEFGIYAFKFKDWLISLSSIGQWLIVSNRLGTQVIDNVVTVV